MSATAPQPVGFDHQAPRRAGCGGRGVASDLRVGCHRCAAALTLLALASACTKPPLPPDPEHHHQPVELKVLTVEGRTTYFKNPDGTTAGLEHDLVKLFAEEIRAQVNFEVQPKLEMLLPLVAQQRAHFAAAGIAITPITEKLVSFALPYQTVRQHVVTHLKRRLPHGFSDLLGKRILVTAGSTQIEVLQTARKDHPALEWDEVPATDPLIPLQRVAEGKADAALADSQIVSLAAAYYPKLKVAFEAGPTRPLAWAFPKDGDRGLLWKAQNFFDRIAYDGTLKRLVDRYYGHTDNMGAADVTHLLRKMVTVLPRYQRMFEEAQRITGLDWRLLAALGFQESHWDPLATSPTGVRGIMMLTEETADRLKVTDRLDPEQSIIAGSRYFAELRDQLPPSVEEPDRTWQALAAYNMGYGHLNGARTIAPKEGIDAETWVGLKEILPKLSRPEYAARLKAGAARGGEAVQLVENVRAYYDVLQRFQPPYDPPMQTAQR